MYLFEFCMFESLGSTMAWGTGEETTHRPWPSISPAQLVVFVSYPMGWRQILVNAVKHFLPLTESFPEVPSAMMNRPATSNGWCLQAVVKVFQVQKDFTFYQSQSISAAVTVYQTELHLAHGFSAGKSKDSMMYQRSSGFSQHGRGQDRKLGRSYPFTRGPPLR